MTNTYLYDAAQIRLFTDSDSAFFLGDALGSVRQLVDDAGAMTMSKSYEPYGEVLNVSRCGQTRLSLFVKIAVRSYLTLRIQGTIISIIAIVNRLASSNQ